MATELMVGWEEKQAQGQNRETHMNRQKIAEKLLVAAKLLAGEVPPEFKEQWKNKDKDGDGKTNEPKPDFLKDKKDASIVRQHVAEELLAVAELLAGEVPPEFKKQWDKDKKDDSKKEASEDILSFSVPLLIRIMEYSKEDAETDMDLHVAVENMLRLGKDGVPLTMDDYDEIVGGASGD